MAREKRAPRRIPGAAQAPPDADARARAALVRRAAVSLPVALARRELGDRGRGVWAMPGAVSQLAARLQSEGTTFEARGNAPMQPAPFFLWCRAEGRGLRMDQKIDVVMRVGGDQRTSFRMNYSDTPYSDHDVYSARRKGAGVTIFASDDAPALVHFGQGGGEPAWTAALLMLMDTANLERRRATFAGRATDDILQLVRAWFPDLTPER